MALNGTVVVLVVPDDECPIHYEIRGDETPKEIEMIGLEGGWMFAGDVAGSGQARLCAEHAAKFEREFPDA